MKLCVKTMFFNIVEIYKLNNINKSDNYNQW